MGGDTVIRAAGLGKKYIIGHETERQRYAALRDVAADAARKIWRKTLDTARGRAVVAGDSMEEFWALKDVDFEIKRGEAVGIVGRNGAGKSTLLKILSRITAPTTGRVEIRGRVASLLEVGTGFHPELTGRENVYLNGAVLGLSRAEIRRKFDEIVEFSGVEKFIDTPVKRYSSGMQVRLAFAVAAHLEPEILLVDEVLAVGDAEFQKRCLGKMSEISESGARTVLFVSHQLGMVARLCSRALLLDGGALVFSGPSGDAIDRYLAGAGKAKRATALDDPRIKRLPAAIVHVETVGPAGVATDQFGWHVPIRVRVELVVKRPPGAMLLGVAVENRHQARVATWVTPVSNHLTSDGERVEVELEIAPKIIAPGGYTVLAALFEPKVTVYHKREGECPFLIVDSGSEMAEFSDVDYGVAIIPSTWTTRRAPTLVQ
ncbi:MAG TPA: ABC transporter ATP-binding protein [Xanthobacteraceae bacterium]|jgi:lipopolysaccharide transport system ATP-binding protein